MSVTLVLVPVSENTDLVTALISSVVLSAKATVSGNNEFERERNLGQTINLNSLKVAREMNKNFDKDKPLMVCSQYKTFFKDKKLLIKTITEHGLQNVIEQDEKIYGNIDSLQFEFEKNSDGVYEMYITHKENENLSCVDDLNEEYQMNVQEQSYMNIKKNLEKQNLKIDSEEVLDDNSIMLTVNLE